MQSTLKRSQLELGSLLFRTQASTRTSEAPPLLWRLAPGSPKPYLGKTRKRNSRQGHRNKLGGIH
jgi:hypothetical protein